MGLSAVAIDLILPVIKPINIPMPEPNSKPKNNRHKLSRISVNKIPVLMLIQNAGKTFEGGGNKAALTKPL